MNQASFAKMRWTLTNTIDWEKSKILKVENNYSKRLISKAWFINTHPNIMNRSDGDSP